jgi:hypothetical protein
LCYCVHVCVYVLIGKQLMHPMGHEPMTSPTGPFLWGVEVPFSPEISGKASHNQSSDGGFYRFIFGSLWIGSGTFNLFLAI